MVLPCGVSRLQINFTSITGAEGLQDAVNNLSKINLGTL